MESIPNRDDIEVIAIDDCSRDNTWEVMQECAKGRKNWILLQNEVNSLPDKTINRGLDLMHGEYFLQLDCDDYLIPDALERVMDQADMDLVFFGMQINNGNVWMPNTMKELCDHTCLYKKSIIGDTRHPHRYHDGGWFFHRDIISKPHTERYTNECAYMYNFPRKGSMMDLANRGLAKVKV